MKRLLLFLIISFYMPSAVKAMPETIHSKIHTIESVTWYQAQSIEWGNRVIATPNDAASWVNYYLATRYSQASQLDLNALVNKMVNAVPQTYEALLVQGWNAGYTPEAGDYLKRAFAMRPTQTTSYASLQLYHEYQQQPLLRKEFGIRLYESDELSPSLLNYSYNVLMSLEPDAILITEGENTTAPLLVLQDVMNVRPDVQVLNLDMLLASEYRETKLRSLNLHVADASWSSLDVRKMLCAALPSENPERKFYYALTLSPDNITDIKEQLYVVGLASVLSKNRIDNISAIKDNFERQFLLDYLTVDFNGESRTAAGKVLSANYLVPMLMLDQHYLKQGAMEKSQALEALALKLASEVNKTDLVKQYLNRERVLSVPYFAFTLDLKEVEGQQKLIRDKIYAAEFEVTNKQYNVFLKYLQDNGQTALYNQVKFDLSRYTDEPAKSFMKGYSADRAPYKKQKFYINYPAISISFEGAQAYCAWLTDQYNAQAGRKFKKVVFRLPTINEWQIAALGYKEFQSWTLRDNKVTMSIPKDPKAEVAKDAEKKTFAFPESDIRYPWFGSYNYRNTVYNHFGCILGNFKFDDKVTACMEHNHMPTADGFTMMAPVGAYFPNGMGLYDVVGNIAEMTNEKGKACGGSWNHTPEESTIESVNTYDGPDTAIGFRVFMEVIEP